MKSTPLYQELCTWLDTLTITQENIGSIRTACFMPFDCEWNGIVREETANRDK